MVGLEGTHKGQVRYPITTWVNYEGSFLRIIASWRITGNKVWTRRGQELAPPFCAHFSTY